MRKLVATLAAAATAFSVVAAGPATTSAAELQFELEVGSGETVTYEAPEADYGTTAGALFGFNLTDPADCGTSADNRCDRGLVKANGNGEMTFVLDANYDPADFDVTVYASDKDGAIGEEVATSGNFYSPVALEDEGLAPTEHATFEVKRGKYYYFVVSYYMAGGGYGLDVSIA